MERVREENEGRGQTGEKSQGKKRLCEGGCVREKNKVLKLSERENSLDTD